MSYLRFGLMILASTAVMFVLMYLNTYALAHLFFSETRAWMAVVMGAAMAAVMMGFMWGMYPDRRLNALILAGAAVVFAGALWLVRSQATVSGESYMRAMIPHHSIAILTSERAGIRDPRVRKLADEIVEAQRREIAEMRYLVGALARGETVTEVYADPPARPGTVEEALGTVRRAGLDAEPMAAEEAREVLGLTPLCAFRRDRAADPILWTSDGGGAMRLNGVLIALAEAGDLSWRADGARMTVTPLGEEADWRADADLVLDLPEGPTVGYRGVWSCGG